MMTARFLLVATILLGVVPAARSADRPLPPNIVIILVDDLRWDDLAGAGNSFVQTPHIDRLAREGALFRNAFAATPLCSPSRGSILTGQYALTHGIIDNRDRIAQSHRLHTFPRELQRLGYETAFFGYGAADLLQYGFHHRETVIRRHAA